MRVEAARCIKVLAKYDKTLTDSIIFFLAHLRSSINNFSRFHPLIPPFAHSASHGGRMDRSPAVYHPSVFIQSECVQCRAIDQGKETSRGWDELPASGSTV